MYVTQMFMTSISVEIGGLYFRNCVVAIIREKKILKNVINQQIAPKAEYMT